jgi:hypothetical protein
MEQSDEYKRTNEVEHVGDMPGASIEEDRVYVVVSELPESAVSEDGKLEVSGIAKTVDVELGEQAEPLTIQAEQLQQLAATVTDDGRIEVDHPTVIDVSSRADRNLGVVTVKQLPDADGGGWNGATLQPNSEKVKALSAPGADRLRGRITSDGPITVEVSWMADGEAVFTDTVAESTQAVELDEKVIYPKVSVTVRPNGDSSQTLNGLLHMT